MGLFVSVIQTVFHHLEKVICVCFSHLRRFGRRPDHPSILSDGWTASENKLSQKFNKPSRRPSFPFVSIIRRQSERFVSLCLDCGLAVFFLLAVFFIGTLDNRENVNKRVFHFRFRISLFTLLPWIADISANLIFHTLKLLKVKKEQKQARQKPSRRPFCVCLGSDGWQSFWMVEMFGWPSEWLKQRGPYFGLFSNLLLVKVAKLALTLILELLKWRKGKNHNLSTLSRQTRKTIFFSKKSGKIMTG